MEDTETYNSSEEEQGEVFTQPETEPQAETEESSEPFKATEGSPTFEVNSLNEAVKNAGIHGEQWEKISSSSEGDVLKKDGSGWVYKDSEGNENPVTLLADTNVDQRRAEIVTSLYEQGYAISDFKKEGEDKTFREVYFADEKGKISYEVYEYTGAKATEELATNEEVSTVPASDNPDELVEPIFESTFVEINLDDYLRLETVNETEQAGASYPKVEEFDFQNFFEKTIIPHAPEKNGFQTERANVPNTIFEFTGHKTVAVQNSPIEQKISSTDSLEKPSNEIGNDASIASPENRVQTIVNKQEFVFTEQPTEATLANSFKNETPVVLKQQDVRGPSATTYVKNISHPSITKKVQIISEAPYSSKSLVRKIIETDTPRIESVITLKPEALSPGSYEPYFSTEAVNTKIEPATDPKVIVDNPPLIEKGIILELDNRVHMEYNAELDPVPLYIESAVQNNTPLDSESNSKNTEELNSPTQYSEAVETITIPHHSAALPETAAPVLEVSNTFEEAPLLSEPIILEPLHVDAQPQISMAELKNKDIPSLPVRVPSQKPSVSNIRSVPGKTRQPLRAQRLSSRAPTSPKAPILTSPKQSELKPVFKVPEKAPIQSQMENPKFRETITRPSVVTQSIKPISSLPQSNGRARIKPGQVIQFSSKPGSVTPSVTTSSAQVPISNIRPAETISSSQPNITSSQTDLSDSINPLTAPQQLRAA